MSRAAGTRGSWLGVAPCVAAVSLLAMLSLAPLCPYSDDQILVQLLDGSGLAARGHVELAASAEGAGDERLGPCVDVRMAAAGAPGAIARG